jgi:hypothetical protein
LPDFVCRWKFWNFLAGLDDHLFYFNETSLAYETFPSHIRLNNVGSPALLAYLRDFTSAISALKILDIVSVHMREDEDPFIR